MPLNSVYFDYKRIKIVLSVFIRLKKKNSLKLKF